MAKRGFNRVLGNFPVQNALVFANFAYLNREELYLGPDSGHSAEKKLLALEWAI